MIIRRRDFLLRSASLAALSATTPVFVTRSAQASNQRSDGRVLVVVELAGGNDGLNTVIPFGDPLYQKNRPGIGIGKDFVLKLDQYHGLHPSLAGFKTLWDEGVLSIVQGVGYPNPNRSHFRSMDIWHSARPEVEDTSDGWLGRSLDARADRLLGKTPAISLGNERLPIALVSRRMSVPAIRDLSEFQLGIGRGEESSQRKGAMTKMAVLDSGADDLAFLRRTSAAAYRAADRLSNVTKDYKAGADYPQNHLGYCLKSVAQMITADFGAEIYYVSLGGFDTHNQQQNLHAGLLNELSTSVAAFIKDMRSHRLDDRIMLMTFSEFGRRVKENGSLGTDHGAASQMFVVRPKNSKTGKAGLLGKHPSLSDLDDGDLKHHTDFRSAYATILDRWLKVDSAKVLGRKFEPIALI